MRARAVLRRVADATRATGDARSAPHCVILWHAPAGCWHRIPPLSCTIAASSLFTLYCSLPSPRRRGRAKGRGGLLPSGNRGGIGEQRLGVFRLEP